MLDVLWMMLYCLVATIIIECGLATLIFKARDKRSLLIVMAAQILTNPIVVGVSCVIVPIVLKSIGMSELTLYVVGYATIAIFEIGAILAEGFIYKRSGFDRPFVMSAVLNASTIMFGIIIEVLKSGITV